MVDLLQVLEGATYAAFIAGAIFAVIELRSISGDRKTDLLMRMNEYWASKDFQETLMKLRNTKSKEPLELEKSVGKLELYALVDYLDGIASLAQFRLIGTKFVCYQYPWTGTWNKLEPYVVYTREQGRKYWGGNLEWIAKIDLKYIKRAGMEVIEG